MISYRITKYDPKKRNENGSFQDTSEWTSINDIGNPKYGNISYEEYEKVENAYCEAIRLILIAQRIDTVKVDSIGLIKSKEDIELLQGDNKLFLKLNLDFQRDIEPLKNGYEIGFWEIDQPIKLILRDVIWMNLVNEKIKIIFGYDYYMYVECEELRLSTMIEIERMGLFVEPNSRQREFIFTDKDGNPI